MPRHSRKLVLASIVVVLASFALAGRADAVPTFARRYNDPADRPLLSPGGQHLADTPNAGGSSGFSEIFAFEELLHCESATLLHTGSLDAGITFIVGGKNAVVAGAAVEFIYAVLWRDTAVSDITNADLNVFLTRWGLATV